MDDARAVVPVRVQDGDQGHGLFASSLELFSAIGRVPRDGDGPVSERIAMRAGW